MKTVGGLRKLRHRGGSLVDWNVTFGYSPKQSRLKPRHRPMCRFTIDAEPAIPYTDRSTIPAIAGPKDVLHYVRHAPGSACLH